MTYRDDHDAAIARADALQEELRRAEAERDRLRGDLERERSKPIPVPAAAPPPPVALVRAPPTALTTEEVKSLIDALDEGGLRARNQRNFAMWGSGAVILFGAISCFATLWAGIALILLGIVAWIINAARDLGDQSTLIAAVRDKPETIVVVREFVSNKGRRWIELGTNNREYATFRPVHPTKLLIALTRHCPKSG